MLTNSILVLLNHPEYQSRIQTELDFHIRKDKYPILADLKKCTFLQAFEIEMERYLNAVPLLLPHFCRDKIKLEDYEIAANTTVCI
jgi:cytochrome P450